MPLQGLFTALLGFSYLAGGSLALVVDLPEAWWWLILILVAVLLGFAQHWFAHVHYPARFGRVKQDDNVDWKWLPFSVALAASGLIDSATLGQGFPGIFPIAVAAHPPVALHRDWPHRKHHGAVVGAAILCSVLWAYATRETRTDFYISAVMLFGVALIVAGCGDHRLLMDTMDAVAADRAERVSEEAR